MNASPEKRKSPLLALILSGIIPGLGQIYNNQILKGLIIFAPNALITVLAYGPFQALFKSLGSLERLPENMSVPLELLGYSVAGLAILLYAMYDAYRTAEKLNSRLRRLSG